MVVSAYESSMRTGKKCKPTPSSLATPLEPSSQDEFENAVKLATAHFLTLFGPPLEGRHRRVFVDAEAHEVVKIPYHLSGIAANLEELDTQGEIFARTYLDTSSETFGIPILRMELVDCLPSIRGLPAWTMSIDCGQVGLTRDGRLVAYDWERY